MNLSFPEAVLVLGLLLAVIAAFSGWLRASILSASVLSVSAGLALGAAGLVEVDPDSSLLLYVVQLALLLTLFSDGLLVDRELLQRHWGPPARALILAMPLTLVMLAGAAWLLFGSLTVAECFLLGAVLSPTDPVVTSAVVTSPRVPAVVRQTLNIESGVNDGLALPLVLFFLVLAEPGGSAAERGLELAGEVAVGAAIGVALALVTGRLLARLHGGGFAHNYEGVFALGVALLAFGLAEATIGNGLIAAFVAGLALGAADQELPSFFGQFSENVSAILQVGTFFLFGALIVSTGWDHDVAALLAFIAFALVIARPAAVGASLIGTVLPRRYRGFIAWFGPKGVASMLFALLVLNSRVPHDALVFDVASFVILVSIVAHGLTDTAGARWIERSEDHPGEVATQASKST